MNWFVQGVVGLCAQAVDAEPRPARAQRSQLPAPAAAPARRRHRRPCPGSRRSRCRAGAAARRRGRRRRRRRTRAAGARRSGAVAPRAAPARGSRTARPSRARRCARAIQSRKARALGDLGRVDRRPRRPPANTRRRLCVMLPLPSTSTPSSASGASAAPSANCCAGALRRHEGQRQHRDVGVGVDVAQRRPDAVVEPALVELRCTGDAGARAAARATRVGQRGRAGRVVAQRVELRVEAAEVVAPPRGAAPASSTGSRAAVCAEIARIARGRPKVASIAGPSALHEGAGRAGLERDHRRAVRDEERGQGRGVHAVIDSTAPPRAAFDALARSVRRRHAPGGADRRDCA